MTPGSNPLSCSRCFKVFDAPEGRAGAAPLCPDCAGVVRRAVAGPGPEGEGAATPGRLSPGLVAGLAALALAAVALGGYAWLGRSRPPPPAVAPAARVEDRVAAWRAAGLVPAAPPGDARAHAESRVRAGREALRADLPARTRAALGAFREALAADPRLPFAAAGFAEAVADLADEDADAEELRAAHELLDAAGADLPSGPARAALGAARARLLGLVPSEANAAEARELANAAAAVAPTDPAVVLARALALAPTRPAEAADALESAFRADPFDRRLLTAAAAARRLAGDDPRALALAAERLSLDGGHPAALRLTAEIQGSAGRVREARAALERWRAAEPDAHLPPLLLARLAYQAEGDLAAALPLLGEALGRARGDFAAAHVLAHRAAVERLAGDVAAAQATVAEALRRVPASAPARFQAALVAWRAGDRKALAESAGVLGDRAGPAAASLLAARAAELSGTSLEAFETWRAGAGPGPHDPRTLLALAATLQRGGASGAAVEVARDFLAIDPLEVRLARGPDDFDEGPQAAAEACARLETIGRAEFRAAATALAAAAACELAFGRLGRADALARAAGPLSPRAAAPLWIQAQLALERGRAKVALGLADAAVEAEPTSAVAREVRARVLETVGRKSAEAAREREVAAAAGLVTARLARARTLARAGRVAEARRLAEALVADRPDLAGPRALLLELAGS